MIEIDGSLGEGGGQILRTSLSLSLITGRPLRVIHIRARRDPPGLKAQHLAAVHAAAEIGSAEVEGDRIGSLNLTFRPGTLRPGRHRFRVGTAGSAGLVLQTILPPLLTADAPSELDIEGGTHNPLAPTFDFLKLAFLPLINRMGPQVELSLDRHGFFPRGGGRIRAVIRPSPRLVPLFLPERGRLMEPVARAVVVGLPRHIAERELEVIRRRLGWSRDQLIVEEHPASDGTGNHVSLELPSEHLTEVFSAIGQKKLRAEDVAGFAATDLERHLTGDWPVGPHLADQLLLPLALAGGGGFVTGEPTEHTRTNIETIRAFLGTSFAVEPRPSGGTRISTTSAPNTAG